MRRMGSGWRKVIVIGLVVLATTGLGVIGRLDGETIQTIYLAAIAAFGLGNAVEHWRGAGSSRVSVGVSGPQTGAQQP